MRILAIETSCDETAIAVLEIKKTRGGEEFLILSNQVSSQIKIHKPFGGVVPHLAQREHQKNLPYILIKALKEAGFSISNSQFPISKQNLKSKILNLESILNREPELLKLFEKHILPITPPSIDAIAVTYGPGLEPALWVGINFAKALAALWKKPLVAVNHLEGHIYASWLAPTGNPNFQFPKFPLLALIVSGGHTELVLMKKHLDYKILGETRDDAAGEAFDKVAKMLGLGYPGGPLISKLAEKGNPKAINFPRPMINSGDFNFSFSGLKTSVLYYLRERFPENRPEAQALQDLAQRDGASRAIFQQKNMRVLAKSGAKAAESASEISGTESSLANIAASFEQAVVDVLVKKTANALRHYGVGRTAIKSLVVGGGVAANKALRSALSNRIAKSFPAVSLHISPLWLCGDNAAMIAVAAYFKAIKKNFAKPDSIKAEGGLKLK